jgi:hypothetical protein
MREISPSAMTAMSIVLTQEVLKKAKTACIDYNNELKK